MINRNGREVDMLAFEEEVTKAYPAVPWRDPLFITVHDSNTGPTKALGCRFCIAAFGMKSSDIVHFPKTTADFELHMAKHHPKKVADA